MMRVVKKMTCSLVLIGVLLIYLSVFAQANPLADYQEAHDIYLYAAASLAAYHDRYGELALAVLQQEGWITQYFHVEQKPAEAKFVFMKKMDPVSGNPIYLLAVAGTESEKDIRSDLRFDKVYFAGRNVEEFAAQAAEKNVDNSQPKVHRGFHQVVQAGFTANVKEGPGREDLADYLNKYPEQKIILTGHSLGGAAATLGGARLLSMGIRPEQVKVVTFGAPAVGNAAFAREFENRLDVTRLVMSGDQITSILQDVIGGYKQFGKVLRWETPAQVAPHPHEIMVYLDAAARNYYEKRWQAGQAGLISLANQALDNNGPRVYIAPLKNSLPEQLQPEFTYMREAVQDEYRSTFSQYIMADEGERDLTILLSKAAAAGCQWLVMTDIEGYLMKNRESVYYLTLQQAVFSVPDGKLINGQSIASNSREMTPLVAMLHDARTLREQEPDWLTGRKN